MTKEEINRYLHEQMGLCWHETGVSLVLGFHKCIKCGEFVNGRHPDYFSPLGYDALREWYETWPKEKQAKFMSYILKPVIVGGVSDDVLSDMCMIRTLQVFHRDRFAPILSEFLKEK